jgi:hypothetical protein
MLLTRIALGLAPALTATRGDLIPALKEGGAVLFTKRRRFSVRRLLVVSQLAGTLMLLTVLGFQSFGIQTTLGVQEGFDLRNLSLISLDPTRVGYSGEQAAAFCDRLLDRVKALPHVTAATLTQSVPVSMPGNPLRVYRSRNSRALVTVLKHAVGRDYFDSTGVPIVLGRRFQREDENDGAGKIIVSEALAREFWGGENPLGRSVEIAENQDTPGSIAMLPRALNDRPGALESGRRLFKVVGVAGDVAEGLVVQKPRPTVYFPLTPADYRHPTLQGITLIVRAAPSFDAITSVRHEISAIHSRVTPFDARTMREQIDRFMAP